MHTRLITTFSALAAIAAFAVPVAAQATNRPLLTHPTGTILAAGTKFTGTNVGSFLVQDTVGNTVLTCTGAHITGELIKNETGNVQGNITAAAFTGTGSGGADCTGFANATIDIETLPWCLKSNATMATDEFQILGGSCAGAAQKISFQLTPSGGGTCTYESTSTTAMKGNFTTHSTGDAVLSVPRAGHTANEDAGFTKTHDSTFLHICPSSVALKMSFTLETDKTPAEPLYISE